MFNVSLVLLPMIIAALFISYEDYRENLVRNRYVLTLLAFGFIFQLLQGNLLASPLRVAGIFVFGALVSFFLWFIGILPAGDSKLLTSLLLYFPLTYYSHGLVVDFLINIFVPVFIFMFLYLLLKSDKEKVINSLKKSISPYRIVMIFVILIGFAWFIYAPLKVLGINVGYFGLVILLFLGYEILFRVSSGRTEIAFVVLAVLRVIIDFENALTLNFLFNTSLIVFLFVIIRFFTLSLSFQFYTEKKSIDDLKPGMELASGIKEEGGKYRIMEKIKASLVGYLMDRKEGYDLEPGPLNREKISRLQKLERKENLEGEKVRVFEKQHFSTFIFAGYFLTFVIGTNFASFVASFI
ncbi:MAG: prepilin peptidase [Candidatus Aenigmatarchaeota archaeon]